MKRYREPEMTLLHFSLQDIVCASDNANSAEADLENDLRGDGNSNDGFWDMDL